MPLLSDLFSGHPDINYLFFITLLPLLFGAAIAIELLLGLRRLEQLSQVEPSFAGGSPLVSVIVSARNEADAIEPALISLLSLAYDDFEVIVVNDRSTDNTGEQLAKMQQRFPRLRTIEVKELPPGWLGKNHGLYQGTLQARGDYLLFTDADIHFEKTTLQRAINRMESRGLDHLCLVFETTTTGGLMNTVILELAAGLFWAYKPWKASDPSSSYYMGVGAFNLVRQQAYLGCGTHREIAMEPVDDIMLGKLIKKNGYRQDCMLGSGFVSVRWYGSLREMSRGLCKNILAGFDFQLSRVVFSVILLLLVEILPLWGLVIASGSSQALCGIAVGSRLLLFAGANRLVHLKPWQAVWAMLSPYIILVMMLRAVGSTIYYGGITWRGTFYSLQEILAQRKR